jgi:dolichol-phosphate mannosyltransferase
MTTQQSVRTVSLVIPVFNEADNVAGMLRRLRAVAEAEKSYVWEFVFVDDGSTDLTGAMLAAEAERDRRVRLIEFTRNFGHQIAISAGLAEARGDAVISLDGDLQHPPEAIPAFLRKWEAGARVVLGVRRATGGGAAKDRSSRLFYWIINRLSAIPVPAGAADFRLLDREAADTLLRLGERSRFLRGMVSWMGYPAERVEYDEAERAAGRSKFSPVRMLCLAGDAVTSLSAAPLRVATIVGACTTLAAGAYALYVLAMFVFRREATIPGWASTILVALFLGGVQLLFLGVLGEYLHRVYDEVKARPLYVVKRRAGFARPPPRA